MLPTYPTLPPLVSQYISLKCLGETQHSLPFEPIENPTVDSQGCTDVPCTTAFFAYYKDNTLSDGFYQMKANLVAGLDLPSPSLVKVLHWSLDLDTELALMILKASVESTAVENSGKELCKVVNNLQVTGLLHRVQRGLKTPLVRLPSLKNDLEEDSYAKVQAFKQRCEAVQPGIDDLLEVIKPRCTEEDIFRAIQKQEELQLLQGAWQFEVFPQWALKYLCLQYNMA